METLHMQEIGPVGTAEQQSFDILCVGTVLAEGGGFFHFLPDVVNLPHLVAAIACDHSEARGIGNPKGHDCVADQRVILGGLLAAADWALRRVVLGRDGVARDVIAYFVHVHCMRGQHAIRICGVRAACFGIWLGHVRSGAGGGEKGALGSLVGLSGSDGRVCIFALLHLGSACSLQVDAHNVPKLNQIQ